MKALTPTAVAAALLLGACGGTANLYSVPAPTTTEHIAIGFRTVEVREVSLPEYAAADTIAIQGANGVVVADDDIRWADLPERAVSLELTRHLTRLSGAQVASEPWPFESYPDATVEVRFETLLAGADGVFRGSGQYFVSSEDGRRDHAHLFDLTVPYPLDGGPNAIATARGQLILNLARDIARTGLR